MKIVASDTGGAVLDEEYNPLGLIATAAVYVEKPYITAKKSIVKYGDPFDYDLSGRKAIKDEVLLAIQLARETKADVIHLDSTLGGLPLRQLDKPTIEALRISERGKRIWLELGKELQPIAKKFWEETGVEILTIGKESTIVRIAEIFAGIYSAKWGIEYAMKKGHVRIGLPRYMEVKILSDKILGKSLDPKEGGLYGELPINFDEKLNWELYPNPVARTFMVLEITSRR
jgi:hypothetical protein